MLVPRAAREPKGVSWSHCVCLRADRHCIFTVCPVGAVIQGDELKGLEMVLLVCRVVSGS